jgi:hypothetical protein
VKKLYHSRFWTLGGWFTWFAAGALVVSEGTTVYSSIQQKKAADTAASIDTSTAAYNAQYDEATAEQLDYDTQHNIQVERQNDQVYLSKEAVSYAAAGVLATSGSALDAQITNVGRMEQQIQQSWVNSQQQQQQIRSQAQKGILYGQDQAAADRMSGTLALVNGGAHLAGMAFNTYNSGTFDFGAGATAPTSDQLATDFVVS